MAESGETFVAFQEGNDFSTDGLSMSTLHPLAQGPLVVVKCESSSLEEMVVGGCEEKISLEPGLGDGQLTHLEEHRSEVTKEEAGSQKMCNFPVLEVIITHTSDEHIKKTDDTMVAVYKSSSSKEEIVLSLKEIQPKSRHRGDSVIYVNDGENVIHLSRSVVDEYRRKSNYFGPLKAAVEKAKLVQDGEEKEVLRTKLMQVKFVMRDGAGQELSGEEMVKAMAKIPGIIPPCDPGSIHDGSDACPLSPNTKEEVVTISFGENDQVDIPRSAIEQYRALSKITEPLTAKKEKSFREENGRKVPVTVISLYPDKESVPVSPVHEESMQQVDEQPAKPRRGRPAGRGKRVIRGRKRVLPDSPDTKPLIDPQRSFKRETPEEPQNTSSNSEAEDGGISELGFDSGIVVVQTPGHEVMSTEEGFIENGVTEVALLPLQLQSAPKDMAAELTSQQAWKYLTEYASEEDAVQGLVTQFNNESWLEVKRMSDFFHCDGEVMTDISFKAVYRKDDTRISYYLRGFSRLLKTGELTSANAINHLFRCLSPDRKLCLGLKPALFETHLESHEQLRHFFKQKGHIISTPFESLFSKECKGIVVVNGNPTSCTFTRGSKTIVGVQVLCRECAALGKQMNQLLKGHTHNGSLARNELLGEKSMQERYNNQLLKQPLRSKGPALNSKEIRHIFTQNVSEIISSPSVSAISFEQDDIDPYEELPVAKGKRKVATRRSGDFEGDEDHVRPSIGVSEEEFLRMIDLCPPAPGILTRSIVKRCNVCQFRAPTMLALFTHMQGHMGALKEKCGECNVQLSSKEAMDVHKKQMHSQRSPVCTICQLDFTTKDQLFDHMNKHRNHHPFECPMCDHKLTNMDAYKKHVRLTHKVKSVRDLKFACKTCNIHFYTRDHLLLHRVNQNHEDVDPFSCKACSFSSTTANEFRSHIWEHSEEERESANIAICPHCYKVFFSAFKLTFHLETKHPPQGKEAEAQSQPKLEPDASEPPRKKKNKGPYLRYLRANEKYECRKCRRRFKTHETLENHEKFSHGEKKVTKSECQCTLCGRRFNALRRLANHMKIHSGNRPVFQCEECGQIYGKKTQVLEHIRTDHAEQVQRHQQQQELLQNNQLEEQALVDITEQPQHVTLEGGASTAWSPIKSPFKVPTVEQTQEAVYSLLQLTDF